MRRAILFAVMFCMIFLLYLPITAQETSDTPNDRPPDATEDAKPEVVKHTDTESQTKDDEVFDLNKYIEETQEKIKNLNVNEILDKIKDQETGRYGVKSIENYLDTMEELFDEYLPKRSPLSIGSIPSGSFFKKVKFACPGDFEAAGVYFSERDLNAYNGKQWTWSIQEGNQQRTMTSEIEAFMYHDLRLNPRFEFANGQVTLHTQFENGGYMWEMAFPDYRMDEDVVYGSYAQKSVVDTTKLKMTAIALEMVTPFGYGLVGKLPHPATGLSGMMWAGPLPIPPFWKYQGGGFGIIYGKMMEGMVWDDERKGWEAWGWNYIEVQNADGYKDDDDATMIGIGGASIFSVFGGTLMVGGGYGAFIGGDESMVLAGTDLRGLGGGAYFMRDKITIPILNVEIDKPRITTIGLCAYGTLLDMGPDTYAGSLADNIGTIVNEAMTVMDFERTKYRPIYAMEFLESDDLTIDQDPAWLLASSITGELGKFKPDACILYAQGSSDAWQIPMIIPGAFFNSKGNKTPRGMLGSYLLNEVERKYFSLIGTVPLAFAHMGLGAVDMFSSNMTAIKAGSDYRISKHFSIYGAALAAWRNNVEYYKEDYWNYFVLINGLNTLKIYNNDDGYRELEGIALFQHWNVDYWEDDIEKFLGVELNSKFVYHVKEGLEISFIAAYFSPGQFYEDILTPKRYSGVMARFSDVTGKIAVVSKEEEIVWGPYKACQFFELTDAFTFQLKFDLKWD